MMTTGATLLVVDSEPDMRAAMRVLLENRGYGVILAEDGVAAIERLGNAPPDLVITARDMPRMDGMQLLNELRRRYHEPAVIVAASAMDLDDATAAIRAGAADYVTRSFDLDALTLSIERALQHRQLRLENETLRRRVREQHGDGLQNLLGASPVMREIFRIAQQAAPSRATMLISGETGTGKGEFARTVHDLSPRANRPFVTVHCAVGQGVLESELFGFEPGSYSTVERSPVGRVEQANGGTLFLDEVAEISPTVQVKLLTMLREGRVERVGGSESIPVDVRVIAATSRDLEREVAAGRFRQDLYYRLNVVQVTMPSLRQRGDDVLLIADYFLKRFALEHRKPIAGVTHGAKIRIRNHLWPGNVRELENAIERAVVMCDGTLIEERHLPRAPNTADASKTLDSLDGELRIPGATLAALERFAILRTLEFVDGATTRAAELLDVSPRTIQYRLHEYGVAKRRREVNPAPETSSDAPLCPPSQRAKPLPRVRARR